MSIDVGQEDLGSSFNNINQLVDAMSATLAFPIPLIQEQRLKKFLSQLPAPQHRHCLLWKLLNSLQQPEVQVVLVAVKEPLVVSEHQVSGVIIPVDDVCQLYVVRVPTCSMVA